MDVKSVCADYFMYNPFFLDNFDNIEILNTLILNCNTLNIKDIVLPCVDNSSLNSDLKISNFKKNIEKIIDILEKYEVNLAIETDFFYEKNLELIKYFNSNNIKLNFDTGNSASYGHDCEKELQSIGSYVTNFHIKDRVFGGDSVMLGEGDFKFDNFIKTLNYMNILPSYFILQAYRDKLGLELFKQQFIWFKKKINNLNINNI